MRGAQCTVRSSKPAGNSTARGTEDSDRSDIVRGRGTPRAPESETLWVWQVSSMAHDRMDPLRRVQVFQLENRDAETRRHLSLGRGRGERSAERHVAGS